MQSKVRVPKIPGNSRFALERWFYKLYTEDLLFNPDDRPENIVHIGKNEPFFSEEECVILNQSLDLLFERHGDTVYEVALKYFHKKMDIQTDYTYAQ
jgi:hypothetical protein